VLVVLLILLVLRLLVLRLPRRGLLAARLPQQLAKGSALVSNVFSFGSPAQQ
jgi:hypothetical protein